MSAKPAKSVKSLKIENAGADVAALLRKFTQRKATIGIIGLGYVGLPLACAICAKDMHAIGFDIDQGKIDKINKGQSYIGNIHNDKIKGFVKSGLLEATADFDRLGEADAILMCVPTPLNKNREPDVSYIVDTARSIAPRLRRGHLIILESSTYPGTTREVVGPILEETGLKSGVDFFLAFSPEREDPGNKDYSTSAIPKVVGGDGADALKLAQAMYDQFLVKTVPVSSCDTAEAVKLTENIFRSVNIALVNELKVVYDAMGIDIWEVIDAAKTKPFGYMPFYPGPGLGGHCIPIDPFYLTWKAREHNISTRFIELAGEINVSMPGYVTNKLSEALDQRAGKSLNGAKILLLGMAYKKNVADIRESPAFAIMHLLQKRKAEVSFYDPFVPEIPPTREHAEFTGMKSVALTPALLKKQDAVMVVTDHDGIDWKMVAANARLIIDTRNALEKAGFGGDHIVKA